MKPAPIITAAVAALAGGIYLCPAAHEVFIFDREAILHGEWWRFVTGHLVHFSPSHLLFNTMVFVLTGAAIESRNRRQFLVLFAASTLSIGLALLMCAPQMQFYGGLSGVATALLFFIALRYASQPNLHRTFGIAICLGTLLKLGVETFSGTPFFAQFDSAAVHPLPLSHAVGILAAAALWCASKPLTPWQSARRGGDGCKSHPRVS